MEETLGKRIAFHRKRLALTQDALAEKLGVTAQAVSKWENDQSCPDIAMLPKLAEVFDITTDELLGIGRKEVHIADVVPEGLESTAVEASSGKMGKWKKALTSPGAAFGFWLFLTGWVALVDAVSLPPYDLADISLHHIAICCGIFTFGLTGLLRRFSLLRLGCAMAGFVFIFHLITEPGIADMDWYVPLLAGLALLGLDLLVSQFRKPKGDWRVMPHGHIPADAVKNSFDYDGTRFRCTTRFGEGDRLVQLQQLSGGCADVTFGELTIDLSSCAEIMEGCTIDLDCAFGSLSLLVPRKYRVESAVSTAFGSVEEKGMSAPDPEATIYVNCAVRFGEICIRHI